MMGDRKPTSTTKDEIWHSEIYAGIKPHKVTKISDGETSVEGRGRKAKDAEAAASKRYGEKKK